MRTLQITVQLLPDQPEYRDVLIASLAEAGFDSFWEEEQALHAYIAEKEYREGMVRENMLEPLCSLTYSVQTLPEKNWNEEWEKNYFQPLLIGGKCLVRAPFHTDYPAADYEVVIEPNMAFGTGNHETTSMMAEYILESEIEGKNVLDMGCGTGILAILACMRGAASVCAVDIDSRSVENSLDNARRNRCPSIEVLEGGAEILEGRSFDIIFANIHKNVLLNDMENYQKTLFEGGKLFISGIYESDLDALNEMASSLNIKLEGYKKKNNWVAASYVLLP